MWIKAGKKFLNSICDDMGYPASLISLINQEPDLNKPLVEHQTGIDASKVVKWNQFGQISSRSVWASPGRLRGWTYSPGCYGNYGQVSLDRNDLANLGEKNDVHGWKCDIQDVDGFATSKSDLQIFKSMDEMVERNSKLLIAELTPKRLAELLSWDEIRIISRDDHDSFATWAWDDRVFLMNTGGSHHFAAAKYVAARINEKVRLEGRYRLYGLNEMALASLRRDFEIFVLSSRTEHQNYFHHALKSFQATYFCQELPNPYFEQEAVFLPKFEKRSIKVSEVLRHAGFQDLGLYLKNLPKKAISS
jgi:hypothetical protein